MSGQTGEAAPAAAANSGLNGLNGLDGLASRFAEASEAGAAQESEGGAAEAAGQEEEAQGQAEAEGEGQEAQAEAEGQEAEAGAEEGSDSEGEETPEGEEAPDGLTPEAQHAFNARVAKEVARRKEAQTARETAEARVAELERETEELRRTQELAGHDIANDFAGLHPEVKAARQGEAKAQSALDQARVLLRKMQRAPEEVSQWLAEHKIECGSTADEQAEWLEQVRDNAQAEVARLSARRTMLEDQVRRSQEQMTAQMSAQADTAYPELKDKSSPLYQEAQSLLRQAPWLRQLPSHKLMIADMLAGRNARVKAQAQKPGGKPAAASKASTQPPKSERSAPGHKPAPMDKQAASRQEARKRLESRPTVDSLAAMMRD